MDNVYFVDKRKLKAPDKVLLAAALAAAEEGFGLRAEILAQKPAPGRADARVRLTLGTYREEFDIEIKARLRPDTLGAVIHGIAQAKVPTLLVTEHVTPPMAETLRAQNVPFIDAAGNAYLDRPPVFVWIKGQRPRQQFVRHAQGRAFAPTGLAVMLTLMCKPELVDRPYRELAAAAGVAHGTVGWVMPELVPLGFVGELAGKRRLFNVDEMLRQWAEAYLRTLRPRLVLGRFRADTIMWWEKMKPRAYQLALAGEPAAARITGHLKPATVTAYGEKIETRFIADYKLRRADDGNVEVLRRFWAFDADDEIAPLPVIYADLLNTGDARCLETAKLIHDRFIAGFKKAH